MIRFVILFGFSFMFFMLHYTGEINKYINMKYAYLSISAVVMMGLLSIFEFIRVSKRQRAEEKKQAAGEAMPEHSHDHHEACRHDDHCHIDEHKRRVDDHGHDCGHSHGNETKLKRFVGCFILFIPIVTGLFLPAHALDSSFVKAKGFSIPGFEQDIQDNPSYQFLKPDTSIFYQKDVYEELNHKELAEFASLGSVTLTDANYLKGMEVIYQNLDAFFGKTIAFDGFAFKGQQVDDSHYFVFRFGFIHCVADSGVFGMLVEFPKGTKVEDDDWVHVSGKLDWEYYQPFKQKIPVLKVSGWNPIKEPKDPYVYRTS
ncbi:TIGR03943 family protein [Paenibacillus sp. N4]|uniref:TIGR03943 family putative permease subunit n=1 Tax=Paenibacillus vietnamensis TaxID=2590547 RepID=UPI001CD13857|nr:TIGR03943 family protein [Paenibacillus vietnamensis]MCA0754301.1 TIGR03943 family protein [Paenibacillus vietnamensis]